MIKFDIIKILSVQLLDFIFIKSNYSKSMFAGFFFVIYIFWVVMQ